MRVLMMISNSNMAVRELYTQILREQFPGWGVSHMSALPSNALGIVSGYDAVIYEIGPADDPRRYKAVLALWEEIKGRPIHIVTHIEGPFREGVVAELEEQGIVCVGSPFTPQAVTEALRRVAPQRPARAPRERGQGLGERMRGLFRRKGNTSP